MKQQDKETTPFDPLYIDNHLLVLNKPAGMLTQPDQSGARSIEEEGKKWVKQRFNKQGNVFLHAVHRLDRPVSGLVLFARSSKALSRLNQFMREGRFVKRYKALVEGYPPAVQGSLDHFIKRKEFISKIVGPGDPEGKSAQLHYHVVGSNKGHSLLDIELVTGRTHQIRAQLSFIGLPIVGDKKYGSRVELHTLFLHHYSLGFCHPTTGESLLFGAPLPAHWSSTHCFFNAY